MKIDYYYEKLTSQETNNSLQLDVFLPAKKLAFEYQGLQHYKQLKFLGKTDQEKISKKDMCIAEGITLVEVFNLKYI